MANENHQRRSLKQFDIEELVHSESLTFRIVDAIEINPEDDGHVITYEWDVLEFNSDELVL